MLYLMALYKQIKMSVEPTLAESFKNACMNSGVSMASEFSAFMADRIGALSGLAAKPTACYDTRYKRRHHIDLIIHQLEAIMTFEAAYRDRIPANLQAGPAYEAAEQAVDSLEQVIDLLRDTY
jgi:hypothetical protein